MDGIIGRYLGLISIEKQVGWLVNRGWHVTRSRGRPGRCYYLVAMEGTEIQELASSNYMSKSNAIKRWIETTYGSDDYSLAS